MNGLLKSPVFYMRINDFEKNGNLKSDFFQNKIVIVFIHANFCGHCHSAMPEFQKAANTNKDPNVFFGAIQIDGDTKGEKECDMILDKILSDYRGVPDYAIFYNKKPTNIVVQSRDSKTILNTVKTIKNKKFSYIQKNCNSGFCINK